MDQNQLANSLCARKAHVTTETEGESQQIRSSRQGRGRDLPAAGGGAGGRADLLGVNCEALGVHEAQGGQGGGGG